MEERPLKALSKSPPRRGSERPNPHPDIRNRWTMASMSQTQMDVPLSEVCDKYYEEVMVPDDSTRGRSSLKGHWKEDGESISLSDKVNFKREELELSSSVSLQDQVEVDDYSDLASAAPGGTHGE